GKAQATTLSMVMNTNYRPGIEVLIANFERVYPDISIQPTFATAGAAYNQVVGTQFSAGNGSDLLWSTSGQSAPSAVWPMAQQGYLANLSGSPWVKRMYPATKPLFSQGNAVYGWDMGFSALSLLSYDKTFFQQNKLTVPTTFPQLLALCQKIKSLGKIPI